MRVPGDQAINYAQNRASFRSGDPDFGFKQQGRTHHSVQRSGSKTVSGRIRPAANLNLRLPAEQTIRAR